RAVAPVAEWVGGMIARTPAPASSQFVADGRRSQPERFRTPLTGANRSRNGPTTRVAAAPRESLPTRCRSCGATLVNRQRRYCDACLPKAARAASAKGVETQRQLRAVGMDRRSSESARAKHRKDAKRQATLRQEWEATQDAVPTPQVFEREIAPLLRRI